MNTQSSSGENQTELYDPYMLYKVYTLHYLYPLPHNSYWHIILLFFCSLHSPNPSCVSRLVAGCMLVNGFFLRLILHGKKLVLIKYDVLTKNPLLLESGVESRMELRF